VPAVGASSERFGVELSTLKVLVGVSPWFPAPSVARASQVYVWPSVRPVVFSAPVQVPEPPSTPVTLLPAVGVHDELVESQ